MINIYYNTVEKYLCDFLKQKKRLKILELGCGRKIYKKLTSSHTYHGLDLPGSKWINSMDKPEILEKVSEFKPKINYDLIFSVATIYLFDQRDLKNLVKLINYLKKSKGKIIIFDYKIQTIYRLNTKQNSYEELLRKRFKGNYRKFNFDWCNRSLIKKKVKEILNINPSHVIEIDFT